MTVIPTNSFAVPPGGSQHPTTSAHPSSSIIIRRMRSRNPKVHLRYFISDGNLDLELEDGTVYRVHRHFFNQYSEDFASEYLSGPASSNFIRLKGVEAQDLDRFLSLIYPSKIGELDISTADEWTSILCLADRWSFLDLRKLALEKLDALSSPAKCEVIVPPVDPADIPLPSGTHAIIPLNDRTEVARDLSGAACSRSLPTDQNKVPLLRLPAYQPIPPSEAMVSIVASQQESSEGLDAVEALDILQSVRESMRAVLHSVAEEASLNGEHASLDVEDVASDVEEASLTVLNDASLDVEQASLDVEGAPLHIENVPASPGDDPSTEAVHEPVRPHIAPDPVAPHIALEPLNISHKPSRITREPVSTTDLLRELPLEISTPSNSFESSLSNSFEPSLPYSKAPPRHRESIQDRLQRVVGKEPLKRPPSLWSSFRRGFVDGYNSALIRNGYDGASSTRGYDSASSMGGSPQPDAPFSPSSPTRSEECSSSKEDHEQTQMSSAHEPEERMARSDEERLARSEERVIGSGEETPALSYENRARDDEEDRVRRRQERMARYREEFNADLRAQVKRTRESMDRATETASRWMDIFGRTTYSSAFYE